ncbi:KpsF/GutQ family sugar-phosphate isomerase [Myroides odoratimimus]|uniref:KpsF/GutQ family sugar-phosphate isomerase n=1 Tax=Myroides odoratimimus TaxID=76832 RepID=UPI000245F5FE|nr:KpsF/GutQ family sugar-phosphate isomerase [Myroides odoratimimus]EHO06451.1 KpsF/GutQ family sugar isomerase [Myroides odoratimimus CCUG 12901]MDM1400647.1 KpsF/GutQ family sugar-phosphate isomerase [Myroides odoratimimus]MDM1414830.1 KpsF/GutQ family sugar-phosphate isomerase [Myroides odoratimimus]MDM1443311.1 KpsF/GutQ family sugar-phosphate isomerase [Myroides odoratimimus]MDM1447263.1 KpsF/GutQ family sugar-phosphate isomerase [Myroides odoratimimus]
MNTSINILNTAKNTLLSESESIKKLIDYLTDDFEKTVKAIFNCKGRIIVTGIGKSSLIGAKIVATFNSTGTPSIHMHAAEAMHGDLGLIQPGDCIICISNSGNSPEIKVLAPILKRHNNTLIAITANENSFLAKSADYILLSKIDHEAEQNNLAPMNSTTAQLVLGDALAACLIELRNFTAEDFAMYHPGGALGKKLLLLVQNILKSENKPAVSPDSSIQEVIVEISEKRLGVTAVVDNEQIIGIITDGDLRRMLQKNSNLNDYKAKDIMSINPKSIESSEHVSKALSILEDNSITQLLVTQNNKYVGVIHLHDILKEGIV